MFILIVEDDQTQREILKKVLERDISAKMTLVKVEVITAATHAEGLKLGPSANCTILDLSLPDSDIEATIGSIRRFRPPVLVTTGYDDPQIEIACMQAGAERVFVKGQIHGLSKAVIECLLKDLYRLNGVLTPHGNAG